MHFVSPTRRLLVAILLLGSLAEPDIYSQSRPLPSAPAITLTPVSRTFVVWGDTRFTDPANCDKSDPDARQAIVQAMSSIDSHPDLAIITGDVVYHGHDNHDWDIFEKQTKPLRDSHIKLFPVLGNHDVDGGSGRPGFFKHFDDLKGYPQLEQSGWYSITYGGSQFLMLDSQSGYEPESAQGIWLRGMLKGIPDDLEFLFIVLHHPLVTHASPGVGRVSVCRGQRRTFIAPHAVEENEKKLRLLLEDFSQVHPLTKLIVFSGHNHNYERYTEKRMTYIVTGGGGATPYLVKRNPTDAYHDDGPTFHYCKVTLGDQGLVFEMFKLNPENNTWKQSDAFRLERMSKSLNQ